MKIQRWKLERCRSLRREAEIAEERLLEIQPSIGARLDPTPRGTTTGHPTENVAIDRISIEELMSEIITEYRELTSEIATACRDIDPTLREVILQRYVDGNEFEDIAIRLGYSGSYIYELHKKALNAVSF
ncbi:MAG: hypothetical protein IIZ78_18825 [Clostridiales bacterium]|nr:hypothetical protein [Clostridiales bacterium]